MLATITAAAASLWSLLLLLRLLLPLLVLIATAFAFAATRLLPASYPTLTSHESEEQERGVAEGQQALG